MNGRDSEGMLTPPPVVYLVFLLIGIGLEYYWPSPFLPQVAQYPVGITVIILSFVVFGMVLREFSASSSSVDHRRPTTEVISSGPFRYSRNPIYVSMTMLCTGIAMVTNNLWILVMMIPAVLVIHYLVIIKEEAFLEEKFGDEYRRYCASVRRWL